MSGCESASLLGRPQALRGRASYARTVFHPCPHICGSAQPRVGSGSIFRINECGGRGGHSPGLQRKAWTHFRKVAPPLLQSTKTWFICEIIVFLVQRLKEPKSKCQSCVSQPENRWGWTEVCLCFHSELPGAEAPSFPALLNSRHDVPASFWRGLRLLGLGVPQWTRSSCFLPSRPRTQRAPSVCPVSASGALSTRLPKPEKWLPTSLLPAPGSSLVISGGGGGADCYSSFPHRPAYWGQCLLLRVGIGLRLTERARMPSLPGP